MIRTIAITAISCLLFFSCSTYATFYGETVRSLDVNSTTRRLDVSYQYLTEFPIVYEKLENIRMINLSGNTQLDISTILKSLPHPEKLEVLVLDSLQLKTIPKEVDGFKNLKQLSLAYNPSLDLEKTIRSIEELPLEFLNLKGNQLTQLPETITHLKTLKDLNLSYNTLHDADSYVYLSKMPDLYSLWLDHNRLDALPETIGTLSQIRYLYIDHNELSSLPNLSRMKNTWVIHAGYNRFTVLPEQLMSMPGLFLVHLNNNAISIIPRVFGKEEYSMMALILDHNPLPDKERIWAEKTFKKFFLLSFKQSY
ncbi:leucine-rich repeat domain-containing protein [Dokdonia ponticola]|uniref:Leucine-rich repeat domain-containing protein n=1 Tax=Dokdonia ponticola TaxID=2041041 RepID=A0ABV9HSW4_9FLAO